jgi:hypothetical protein
VSEENLYPLCISPNNKMTIYLFNDAYQVLSLRSVERWDGL